MPAGVFLAGGYGEISMERKKYYIDMEQLHSKYGGAVGICMTGDGHELVCAGKLILSMSVTEKKEKAYQVLAEEYDVRFIFDDAMPELEFYPIPQMCIFAVDSKDGSFASPNTSIDISEENAPVYYISKDLRCYYVAPNMSAFLQLIVFNPGWKNDFVRGSDSAAEPSPEGKTYLINKLNLSRITAAPDKANEPNEITIFKSLEEAKKVIPFYNIDEDDFEGSEHP